MKKTLVLLTICLSACGPSAQEQYYLDLLHKGVPKETFPLKERKVTIFTYQGCSYLVYANPTDHTWGGHMGNCPNPIHKYVKPDSLTQ